MRYGRDDEEWDVLAAAARRFLEERGRLATTTSYTELNAVLARRTDLRPFDFDREDERGAMGYLLGRVTSDTYDQIGAMLSALVQYLNENDAGPGFFELAIEMQLLPRQSTAAQRLEFWVGQVASVHRYFRD
jgi:hypothetical protein